MKKNYLKLILILLLSLHAACFSINDIITKIGQIPQLVPKQKDNPLKEQIVDIIDKYSGLFTKTVNFMRSLDDSACTYRIEQFAVRAFAKHRNEVDKSLTKFSGNFPQILGKFDQCINNKALNMTYHMLTIGSSDLRLGFGFCLPNECSEEEMAITSNFLMNVTEDLIKTHIMTYKLPLQSLQPYENVKFTAYRGDNIKIYYFTWISIVLQAIWVIMILLFVIGTSKNNKKKFDVLFGTVIEFSEKNKANNREENAMESANDIGDSKQETNKNELKQEKNDQSGFIKDLFDEKVSKAKTQVDFITKIKRSFLDCFDFSVNYKLLTSRKNWSATEVAVDVSRFFGIILVVIIRTMIYKLVMSRDILDVNLIFKVAEMGLFGLAVYCVFLPDLFLILSGIVGVYSCLRLINKINPSNIFKAFLLQIYCIIKKWKNLFICLAICLIYFREVLPSISYGPYSKIHLTCSDSSFYKTMFMVSGSFWNDDVCASWTLWVPMIMQIFLVTPFISYIGHKSKKAAYVILIGLVQGAIGYGYYICWKFDVTFINYKNALSYFVHFHSNPIARSTSYWVGCLIAFSTFEQIENLNDSVQYTSINSPKVTWIDEIKANKFRTCQVIFAILIAFANFMCYALYFKIGNDNYEPKFAQWTFVIFAGNIFVLSLFYTIWKLFEIFPRFKFSIGSTPLFNILVKQSFPIMLFHILVAMTKTWTSVILPHYSWYAFTGKLVAEYGVGALVAFVIVIFIDYPLKNVWQVFIEDPISETSLEHELKLMTMNYPLSSKKLSSKLTEKTKATIN